MKKLLLISTLLLISVSLFGQSLRGKVTALNGSPLPYAAIVVKGTKQGTSANSEGRYELKLSSGTYEITFQSLGYQTITKKITITDTPQTIDISLPEQAVTLAEVRVGASREDPAYTIMRKAISMARPNYLVVSSWSAKTYSKGTGVVKKIPKLFQALGDKNDKKEMKEVLNTVYVLEGVSEYSFAQPNTIKEKVVSIKSNFPPGVQPVIGFGQSNFYNPTLGPVISPLSPKAFGTYEFEYLGFFEDRGVTINKIKVIPKRKGLNVFAGILNIIENSWAIHSLEVSFKDNAGFQQTIKQLYNPIEGVWMPYQFELGIDAKIFGIAFAFNYVTSVKNFTATFNPKYQNLPTVVDEKIDKEAAVALREKKNKKTDNQEDSTENQPTELTSKDLNRLIKEYEKSEKKERKNAGQDVSVVRDVSFSIDSLARTRPDSFWVQERQIALTEKEQKGIIKTDSIYKANAPKYRKDSLNALPKFKLKHLLTGHTYNYGKKIELRGYPKVLEFTGPLVGFFNYDFFNAVEGYKIQTRLKYTKELGRRNEWSTEGFLKYGTAWNRLMGGVSFSRITRNTQFSVKLAQDVVQINPTDPIPNATNTSYSLLQKMNEIRLLEKKQLRFGLVQRLTEKWIFSGSLSFEARSPVSVNAKKAWRRNEERTEFPPNESFIEHLGGIGKFERHNATFLDARLSFRPFAKNAIFNGEKFGINNGSPRFSVSYKGGFGGVRFNQVEFSISDEVNLPKGRLQYAAHLGDFIGEKPKYFIDYQHFNGNTLLFVKPGLESFRFLDFYRYSTPNRYFSAHADYQFKSFLLTQITALRLYGIRESVFVNFLNTNIINHVEVGYGFKGVLKVFGLEAVSQFQNGKYLATGIRISSGL